MMPFAVPWLPPPIEGEAETALSRILSAWLAEWIADPVILQVTAIDAIGPGGVAAGPRDRAALGFAACAGRADAANAGDTSVMASIGDAMVADLAGQLGEQPEAKLRHFAVEADNGSWRLTLAVGDALLIRARKSAAGSARRPTLGSLERALENEFARLGCHLGEAALTAADVAALAVGDMIVLDRSIAAAVPLAVGGVLPQAGQARIGAEAETIRITVTEPPNLLRRN